MTTQSVLKSWLCAGAHSSCTCLWFSCVLASVRHCAICFFQYSVCDCMRFTAIFHWWGRGTLIERSMFVVWNCIIRVRFRAGNTGLNSNHSSFSTGRSIAVLLSHFFFVRRWLRLWRLFWRYLFLTSCPFGASGGMCLLIVAFPLITHSFVNCVPWFGFSSFCCHW